MNIHQMLDFIFGTFMIMLGIHCGEWFPVIWGAGMVLVWLICVPILLAMEDEVRELTERIVRNRRKREREALDAAIRDMDEFLAKAKVRP